MRLRHVLGGLAGAAAMIAIVNIASRLVGFGRWLVMLSEVGANPVGNAYSSANLLPNVLFEVVAGGALAGAVVPLVAAPLARAMRKDVDRIASALLGWSIVTLVPVAVVVAVAARPLVALFMPGKADVEIDLAATFLTTFAAQIPLYGVGVVLTGVLQAQRRFLAAAVAPLLNSLVVIGVFVAFGQMVPGPKDDPAAVAGAAVALLGWGTTAGVAVMSLPLFLPVHRTGIRFRPVLRFPEGVAARARALAMAGLGALLAQQLSVLATLGMANRYGEGGTVPVFLSMQAVYFLPYAVLAFPLATATLPRLAERAANDDMVGFSRLAAGTTRAVLLVSAAGAAALVAAAPAVEQVFDAIADGDVTGMGTGLTWMAPGLLGFALVLHLSRALYTLHKGRTAVIATAAGWLVVAATAAVAVLAFTGGERDQPATLSGLGLATTLGMSVAGLGLLFGVLRAAGRDAVAGVPRTVGVLLLVGLGGAVGGRWVADRVLSDGLTTAFLAGLAGAAAAAAALLAAVWLVDRSALHALTERALADGSEPVRAGELPDPGPS